MWKDCRFCRHLWISYVVLEIKQCMYSRYAMFLRSLECYFDIYFSSCFVSAETFRHSSTYIILYFCQMALFWTWLYRTFQITCPLSTLSTLCVLKFLRGNINMQLHFMLFIHIDVTQVVVNFSSSKTRTYPWYKIYWTELLWSPARQGLIHIKQNMNNFAHGNGCFTYLLIKMFSCVLKC